MFHSKSSEEKLRQIYVTWPQYSGVKLHPTTTLTHNVDVPLLHIINISVKVVRVY